MDNGLQQFISREYLGKVQQRLATLGSAGKATALRGKLSSI
jgi:hypothetical protein